MLLNLKLSQKGLLLISVPLAFELCFVAALSLLQDQAQRAEQEERRSTKIVIEIDSIMKGAYDTGIALVVCSVFKSPIYEQRVQRKSADLNDSLVTLASLVEGHPVQKTNFDKLDEDMKKFNTLVNFGIDLARAAPPRTNLKAYEIRDRVSRLAQNLDFDCSKMVSEQQRERRSVPLTEATAKTLLLSCLLMGVAANIALSIWLSAFFSKDITQRLSRIVDNTARLTHDSELLPASAGSDEIAQLDQTFHAMAGSLRQAARREREILENVSDVFCSLDEQHIFTLVSPACLSSWGYSPDELVGMSFFELIPSFEQAITREKILLLRSGEDKSSFESGLTKRSSQRSEVLWSAHWSEPQKTLFLVAHDITERKETERLRQDVVAMVSHDLRAPLSSISVVLEMLTLGVRGPLPEPALKDLAHAQNNTKRLVSLVEDLLDLERLEAGSFQLNLENTPVDQIIQRSVNAVIAFAEERGVQIAIETGSTTAEIVADPERIIQVLVNLITNAVKFSSANTSVSISTEPHSEFVELSVKDQGRGLAEGEKELLFQKFRQVDRSDALTGTGLGLAICKTIVERHGGTIGVVSGGRDKGCTFWFRIPSVK